MNRLIKTIFGVGLLALSGNATAIMIDKQVYGLSSYTLPDIDQAIVTFSQDVSTKREKKLLKKARKFDKKVEKLGNKLAATDGNRKKLKKLIKKENILLAILADYLPQAGVTLPEAGSLLPIPEDVFDPLTGSTAGNNLLGTGTTTGSGAEASAVPEPATFALLCIGFIGIGAARKLKRH